MRTKNRLLTPEQLSKELGGTITARQIRRLLQEVRIESIHGSAHEILLTDAQAEALMAYLTEPAREAPVKADTPEPSADPAAPRSPAEVMSLGGAVAA